MFFQTSRLAGWMWGTALLVHQGPKCETNRVTATRHVLPSFPPQCRGEGRAGRMCAYRGHLACFGGFFLFSFSFSFPPSPVDNMWLHSNVLGNAKHPDDTMWLQVVVGDWVLLSDHTDCWHWAWGLLGPDLCLKKKKEKAWYISLSPHCYLSLYKIRQPGYTSRLC